MRSFKKSPSYTGAAARRIVMLRRAAQKMLLELESSHLEVVLIPSRDPDCAMRGGMIRAVQERNARWCRDFCAMYPKHRTRPRRKRKPDTRIRRELTINGLNEILRGRCRSVYAERLAHFIERAERRRDF